MILNTGVDSALFCIAPSHDPKHWCWHLKIYFNCCSLFRYCEKRCKKKRKHAKTFVIYLAKRSENHAKRFAFRFHFAYRRKKIMLKRDRLHSLHTLPSNHLLMLYCITFWCIMQPYNMLLCQHMSTVVDELKFCVQNVAWVSLTIRKLKFPFSFLYFI
jgi:hypothetical protein